MTTMNTLQNLCLDKIVSDFSRYYQAYCSTENSSLKFEFEFLKKKFSFRILQKLNEEYQLKTEYLDVLINKYLKVLDTRWLKEWSWDTVVQKLAEIGPHIVEVIFKREQKSWKKMMCHLPNLKSVYFQCGANDEFLLYISRFCSNIESINVRFSRVSDDGLKHLCYNGNGEAACPALKKLLIQFSKIKADGIKYLLKNLPSLERVDYRKLPLVLYSIHKNDISNIYNIKRYNLTDLNLIPTARSRVFDNVLKICLILCPHLKSFSSPVFKQEHLLLYPQLHKLQKLYLDCCNESPLELNEFLILHGNSLTALRISNFSISLSVLTQNCPNLNYLHLKKISFQHDSVPVSHSLERIIFDDIILRNPVNALSVMCLLSSSLNLKQLGVINCKLFSAEINTQILKCSALCKLKVIDFSGTDIELIMLENILLTCPTLNCMVLDRWDKVSDFGAIDQLESVIQPLPNRPILHFHLAVLDDGHSFDIKAEELDSSFSHHFL